MILPLGPRSASLCLPARSPASLLFTLVRGREFCELRIDGVLRRSAIISKSSLIHSQFIGLCFSDGFADALVRCGKRSATRR
jgi:hypothetical protein